LLASGKGLPRVGVVLPPSRNGSGGFRASRTSSHSADPVGTFLETVLPSTRSISASNVALRSTGVLAPGLGRASDEVGEEDGEEVSDGDLWGASGGEIEGEGEGGYDAGADIDVERLMRGDMRGKRWDGVNKEWVDDH
jgi:hypothetical protein